MRKNKKEIPPEFVTVKKRAVYSSLFGFQKDTTIVSYVPKKSKNVILLSTMHNDDEIDESTGEARKPEIITFYNTTKGAVDVVDEMGAAYSTARISKRWPMVIFFTMLNVASINSRILLMSIKDPPLEFRSRRHFQKSLGLNLVEDYTEERRLKPMLPLKLKQMLSSHDSSEPPSKKSKTSNDYKRCSDCYCTNKKDRKSKYCCPICKRHICMEHMSSICEKCKNSICK